MKIPCPIHTHAQHTPDAIAIRTLNRAITYKDLDALCCTATESLRVKDIKAGNVVAFALPLSLEYIATMWAALRLGALIAPVNPSFPEAFMHDRLESIAPKLIVSEVFQGKTTFINLEMLLNPNLDCPPFNEGGLDTLQPATLILSSGSSGTPKAVCHNLAAHMENSNRSNANIPYGPGDSWLLSLPLYHISGLATMFRSLFSGAALALPNNRAAIAEAIQSMPISHLSLVPAQLHDLLNDPNSTRELKKCKAILLGGAALPDSLLCTALDAHLPVHTTYGLTEMASQVCTTPPGAGLDTLKSAGYPLAKDIIHTDLNGVIKVGGLSLFLGYWMNGKLESVITEDAYFTTGDLGCFDESGRLHVLGRRDNMFICGGENIQAEAVEAAAYSIQSVKTAICVPIPDERLGHIPVLFLNWDNGIEKVLVENTLQRLLPYYAVPRHILDWPSGTQDSSLKPSRNDLKCLAEKLLAQVKNSEN